MKKLKVKAKDAKAFDCVPSAVVVRVKAQNPPDKCDVCKKNLRHYPTFYDAATSMGPWAWMCKACMTDVGIGVGVGTGQEYNSVNDEKVRG